MKTLLIVTQLDYKSALNIRIHHIVKNFQDRFDTITIIYRTYPTGTGFKENFRLFPPLRFKKEKLGKVSLIGVGSLFNIPIGLGISVLGLLNPYMIPSSLMKKILRRVFSFMGFIFELSIFPSFTIAYFLEDREKYDVFIGGGIWAAAFGYFLKKIKRINLLVYDDYDYLPGYQPISKFRRWYTERIEVFLLRQSDVVISIGEWLGQLREKQTHKQIYVVPNGVDYELFSRAQHKISHPPTLIYTGAVEAVSGLEVVFHALSKLKMDISDIRLVIIGKTIPPYNEENLKTLIQKISLENNVVYLGIKSYIDLPLYLKEADIGLALFMPMGWRKFCFPLKIIEYMAAGLPVITTKGVQSEYLVKKAQAGIAIEYNNILMLIEGIKKLLNERNFYERCSENAINFSKEYDWKILMEKYYSIIKLNIPFQNEADSNRLG